MSSPSLRVQRLAPVVRAQVVDNLRQAILEMRFKPGERLVERELVDATGVSRTSIREALRELAGEGLVTTIPNKGSVVATVTRREAAQIYELRSSLEALAGRLFVQRASDAQVATLRKAFTVVERAYGRPTKNMLAAKDAFYAVLFEGADNDVLRQVVAGFHARATMLRALSLSHKGRPQDSIEEIRAIVEAVEARDADAAGAACARHVEQAGRASLEALDVVVSPDAASNGAATRRS